MFICFLLYILKNWSGFILIVSPRNQHSLGSRRLYVSEPDILGPIDYLSDIRNMVSQVVVLNEDM